MANVRLEDKKNPSPAGTGKTDSRASSLITDKEKTHKSIMEKETKGKTTSPTTIKKRYWRFELYPESLPENWLEFLTQSCIEFALSPLHDKDIYTKDVRSEDDTDLIQGKIGKVKKPHYHGIFAFTNPTTFNNVYESFLKPLGQPIPLTCDNIRRAYEYFWHKNNPEKAHYDKSQIQVFNGFDILNYVNIEQRRVLEIKLELVDFIRNFEIYEPIDFLEQIKINFSAKEDLTDYLDIAFSNTSAFNIYIRSNRHKRELSTPQVKIKNIVEGVEL